MKFFALRAILCACLLSGCNKHSQLSSPTFYPSENPKYLSDWGQVVARQDSLKLGEAVVPYALNTGLFTDYAQKLRTIWMPEGTSANYTDDSVLDFPVGTVITKTFYYQQDKGGPFSEVLLSNDDMVGFTGDSLNLHDLKLIETRVLVNRESGWEAISYRWNDEQTDAAILRTGDIVPLTLVNHDGSKEAFNYIVPDVNQCASCHATNSNTREIWPIGPKTRHLNRDFAYHDGIRNQIANLQQVNYLVNTPEMASMPKNVSMYDQTASLDARARSYLDINCSHCHSPVGPADTSGLHLVPGATGANLGLCKLPIAAGSGTGDLSWGIVPGHPQKSILLYRMDNVEPDEMMPEIGRSTIHKEGVSLISAWIEKMEGECT